jgi:hypothetical protein
MIMQAVQLSGHFGTTRQLALDVETVISQLAKRPSPSYMIVVNYLGSGLID